MSHSENGDIERYGTLKNQIEKLFQSTLWEKDVVKLLFWQSLSLHPTIILRYLRSHLHKFNRQLGPLSLLRPDAETEITVISYIAEISWPVKSHLHILIGIIRGWHLEGSLSHTSSTWGPSSDNQRWHLSLKMHEAMSWWSFVVLVPLAVREWQIPTLSYMQT